MQANATMVQVMQDIDRLLASSSGFLLGSWIADARAMAVSAGFPEDADFLEWNARSQGVSLPSHVRLVCFTQLQGCELVDRHCSCDH